MNLQPENLAKGYDSTYRDFDTPLQIEIRTEAYGVDIGQHSWVTLSELQEAIQILKLSSADTLLDFGCGPCGPLTFLVKEIRCNGFGVDISAPALAVGQNRAERMGISSLIQLTEVDGNEPVNFKDGSFNAVVSFDVVLHLRDRDRAFHEIARLLAAKGRFLFTDAGVVTGAVSNEDIRHRSINGFTQFVPSGFNEELLKRCGFRILEQRDRTDGVIQNASGRIRAREKYRSELLAIEGEVRFEQQQKYLETVVNLAERKALSRISYLAEIAGL
jgi:SAM-dependent methyltransferase